MAEQLNLSALQAQTLVDMGFDTWYIEPVSAINEQVAETTTNHQESISHLVGALSHSLSDTPSRATAPAPMAAVTALSQPVYTDPAKVNATIQKPVAISKTEPLIVDQADNEKSKAVAPSLSNKSLAGTSRREISIPTIEIDTTRNVLPPAQRSVHFSNALEQPKDWEALKQHVIDLAQEAQLPYSMGEGALEANDFLVLPPLDYPLHRREIVEAPLLTDNEEKLLSAILSSINISRRAIYATPIIKTPMRYGLDVDQPSLDAYLPILSAELAFTQPERLWLFGTAACHAVLKTSAPLSALMFNPYDLSYTDGNGTERTVEVICLPGLDYLLAVPSAKASVWQRIKVFS